MKRQRDSADERESSPESQHSKKSTLSQESASTRDDAKPTYGMFFGSQLAHMRLSGLWRFRHPYKRVRITKYQDIEAAYPYICACIEDGTIADALEELVIGNENWSELDWYNRTLTDENRPVREAREGTHEKILAHVRGLGLSDKVTERMVKAIEWKKEIYLGRSPETEDGGMWQNMEFTSAACVVILSLCRNITTVHMEDMQTQEGEHNAIKHEILGDYLLRNNFGKLHTPSLQKLRNVIVNPQTKDEMMTGDTDIYMDVGVTDLMRCFHRLPAMESFCFLGVTVENGTSREFLPPGTGTFTKLEFKHIDLRGTMIATMIRAARGLHEVALSLGGMVSFEDSAIWVHPKTVGKALLEHKVSLKVLDLDIQAAESSESEQEHDSLDEVGMKLEEGEDEGLLDEWHKLDVAQGSGRPILTEQLPNTRRYGLGLGSLHDFEALTHLSIQPEKLHGGPTDDDDDDEEEDETGKDPRRRLVDMLPPSLEYLCLYGYEKGSLEWLDEQVEELMEEKSEKLPKLKEVKGYDELINPSDFSAQTEDKGRGNGSDDGSDNDEDEDGNDDDDDDEDSDAGEHWKRPRPNLGWLKA